jgi:hypothetical protein
MPFGIVEERKEELEARKIKSHGNFRIALMISSLAFLGLVNLAVIASPAS